jgi:enterochelin esterase family protein
MAFKTLLARLGLAAGTLALAVSARAQITETYFSDLLIEGETWSVVSEGYGMTDAACFDAGGNFYFTDVAKGTNIFRVAPDGTVAPFLGNAASVSGLKPGPDGRFYACQGKEKRIIAFDTQGNITVLATNVEPNDLVLTAKGGVYFTETGKKQVDYIDPSGELRVADKGITAPNGLSLSPDQQTLAVSDYGGLYVWTFRVEPDGTLNAKENYMTARAPEGKPSRGDGMATDQAGRYYVCTALGVQVFDPTGRLCGVMPSPQPGKPLTNVGFGGANLDNLYITCGDKIYRRKVRAHGAILYQKPAGK